MTRLLVDLDVEVETPEDERLSVRVEGDGHEFSIISSDLARLAAGRSTGEMNQWAEVLAEHGACVTLCDDGGPILKIGDVRVSWWQRVVTRSRHVKVCRWRAATALKAAALSSSDQTLMPPPVEWPKLPPLPWWNRKITTTHDPYGGGHPRLYLSDTRVPATGRGVRVLYLLPGETVLGSGPDVDLQLDGMDGVQAVVNRTADDEYVLSARSETVPTVVHGQHRAEQQLRTGTRIEIGPWRLTYVRDEYADHGRPFGGRIGGELGVQRPQSSPQYQR